MTHLMAMRKHNHQMMGYMDTGLKPQETVNHRYHILRQLGRGKLERTYLAEDRHRFNEYCILQEFAPEVQSSEGLQKTEELFQRKAQALYTLDHPQIPRFRELFPLPEGENKGLFLVQDYIIGPTYRELLTHRLSQGHFFTESEVTEFLLNVLPVLAYLHHRGIIHRDITPDNIICRDSDKLPVLIDFGSIKQLSAIANSFFTQSQVLTGQIMQVGQSGYAPQEQIEQGLVSSHSDLYGLAATALVLLSGKEPLELIDPHTGHWPSELALSSSLTPVLSKMLAKHPKDRYTSAQEVIDSLSVSTPHLDPSSVYSSSVTPPTIIVAPDATESNIPDTTSTEDTLIPNLSKTETTMALTSSPAKSSVSGCLSKLILVLMLILGSGMVGWWAGKTWISQFLNPTQAESPKVFSEKTTSESPSEISDEEFQRKTQLRTRRQKLGIDHTLFVSLVDEVFGQQYPSEKGRALSNEPEDDSWRKKWDQTGDNLLDILGSLSPEALEGIGTYNQTQRDNWKLLANNLHLSSRAVYDLVDGRFFRAFPEQKEENFIDQPLGQIWTAMILDTLTALQSGSNYEALFFDSENPTIEREETLQPGAGKAYVVRLEASQNLAVKLETNGDTFLSIYSPTGTNNLLEDSTQQQWSGELSESGYYEFTIVAKSDKPLKYKLIITK
ncbi:serine/threonine-protein kinase [Aphanothece sacrum]|uniref:non-specific serine/threonine protein kinase n=1 Tax=Aphanothece sacrum FPU1 TaxID=1920663 RepID=A0A401ILE7_APHSA|nr:serine/threonine-protein kinase [Aphanothece sacrum]GBF82061.1 serine/threonine protein kinase [Aphanothece sacrum FPU1]